MNTLFNTIPRLAGILSGDSPIRRGTLLFSLWYFVLSRKLLGIQGVYAVGVVYAEKRFTLFLEHPMDIAVLREVYLDKEYAWCPIADPQVIIDLGAHFGETALYYHARFPKARIVAVEPSHKNFLRLKKHTDHIENIIAVEGAVGAKDGVATLNEMESSLGHSLLARAGSVGSFEVPLMTLDTLFKHAGIARADLIKFDIEGAEFELFESISPKQYADAYIGELHFDLVDGWKLKEVKEIFGEYSQAFKQISPSRYIANFFSSSL